MDRTLFLVRLTDLVTKEHIYIKHHAIDAFCPSNKGTKVYTSGGEFEVVESIAMIIKQMNRELSLVKEVL